MSTCQNNFFRVNRIMHNDNNIKTDKAKPQYLYHSSQHDVRKYFDIYVIIYKFKIWLYIHSRHNYFLWYCVNSDLLRALFLYFKSDDLTILT